jgi:hypothetical protein
MLTFSLVPNLLFEKGTPRSLQRKIRNLLFGFASFDTVTVKVAVGKSRSLGETKESHTISLTAAKRHPHHWCHFRVSSAFVLRPTSLPKRRPRQHRSISGSGSAASIVKMPTDPFRSVGSARPFGGPSLLPGQSGCTGGCEQCFRDGEKEQERSKDRHVVRRRHPVVSGRYYVVSGRDPVPLFGVHETLAERVGRTGERHRRMRWR